MNLESESTRQERRTPAEFAAAAALIISAVLMAPVLAALSAGLPAGYAWTRPFVLDEFHTLLLIEEPTVRSLMSKLAQGGDYNPPGLYFVLRPWTAVLGTGEASLRAFSTAVTAVGLLGLYVALGRGVAQWAALAATLAAWGGMPVLQVEAIDARFYALWFAEAAWLVAVLPAFVERGGSSRGIAIGLLSVLICVTHYFGVFSLMAIVAGQFTAERLTERPFGRTFRRCAPTLAGPLALTFCIPLYFGQRAALEVPTWLAPSGRAAIEQLIDPFFRSLTLAGAALALVGSIVWRSGRSEQVVDPSRLAIRPLGAALGLLGLPVILLAFHFVVQPVSVARYAIPSAIGIAAAAAVLLSACDTRLLAVVLGLSFLMPAATLRLQTDLWDAEKMHAPGRLARTLVLQGRSGYPLVFVGRGDGYLAWRYSGLPANAIRLAYPDGQDEVSVFDRLERSVARRMNLLFDAPAPVRHTGLSGLGPFIYCAAATRGDVESRFPGATVRHVSKEGPIDAYVVTPGSDGR